MGKEREETTGKKREVVCEGVFFSVLEKERVVCERSRTGTGRRVLLGGQRRERSV